MFPEDEHFNIISGAEASTDSHYIYNRSRMKKNKLFKNCLMSLLKSNINSQLYCATCQMALAEEGRAVKRNPNTTASPVTQTAMRGLITNPSIEHLFARTRHKSTFSEN